MNYKTMKLPELLAPAGSFLHLKAAVLAGADAVYFGGSRFGARAYAENFPKDKVIEGLDYVHFHDRRAYMTVNTLVKEKELQEELYEYLLPFYEAGLDGVIVQDLGAASFIRNHFPGMEVHGSTQMMITSVPGALKAKEMGMNRVVPARELSMEEVTRIKKETGLEVEVFIHGALCYCYSGQCLFSSMYGGRSGNRGRCAQPCRLPYTLADTNGIVIPETKGKHLLSPKDLYSLSTLPSMIEHGVDSLKIEGRMKNIDYVAGVVSIYRKYLDQYDPQKKWQVDPKDVNELTELYSRTGFTDGYWISHNGKDMMSTETPRHLGLKIGSITNIQKNKITIALTEKVAAKDLIVIPGGREEEVVLTVPNNIKDIISRKKKGYEIILNAPKTKWLKTGLAVYRRHNECLQNRIKEEILDRKIKYPVSGSMVIQEKEPLILVLESRGDVVSLEGEIPSIAQNRPTTEKDILKQMNKTGNVPFLLDDFEIHLKKDLFVQASALKELRQKGYDLLEKAHKEHYYRDRSITENLEQDSISSICHLESIQKRPEKIEQLAAVYDEKNLEECLDNSFFSGIILSMDFLKEEELKDWKARIRRAGKKACLSLPHVLRQESKNSLGSYLLKTVDDHIEWDVIYINNINEMDIMAERWPEVSRVYGASFYQWNQESRQEIHRIQNPSIVGKDFFDLPYELSFKECAATLEGQEDNIECMLYGRFPVMLSAQCLKKTSGRCNHTPEEFFLIDRKKRKLPVTTHCNPGWTDSDLAASKRTALSCYNMIWTDEPRNLIGEDYTLLINNTSRFRYDFFGADVETIQEVVRSFKKWMHQDSPFMSMGSSQKNATEEHWRYGIE